MTAIEYINNLKIKGLEILNTTIFLNNSAVDFVFSKNETVETYIKRCISRIESFNEYENKTEYMVDYLEFMSYIQPYKFLRKEKLEKINKIK